MDDDWGYPYGNPQKKSSTGPPPPAALGSAGFQLHGLGAASDRSGRGDSAEGPGPPGGRGIWGAIEHGDYVIHYALW